MTDDTTHQETWELLTQLTGRKDILYVADCKLATTKNLQYIVNRGGRFISPLPRTLQEGTVFRKRLAESPDKVAWQHRQDTLSEKGELLDRLKVCAESLETKEGYRLYWYHSSRKQARDAATRQRLIERTIKELNELEDRLQSPRSRFRDQPQVAADQASDGVFPLITSEQELSAADVLAAYKRQPISEKRFSQFKTDFAIAPVYLQEIGRIHALLCIYSLALCVQTLLERELRQARTAAQEDSLPLYPEERACRAPTTRRVLDVLEVIQRHELQQNGEVIEVYITELRPLHRQLLKLLGVAIRSDGQ